MDSNNLGSILIINPNLSRAELQQALSKLNADITFTKKDGTLRVMKCTLRSDVVVPYEKKTDIVREGKDNIMPVWDLEAEAWRSVNMDTIKEVTYYGIC